MTAQDEIESLRSQIDQYRRHLSDIEWARFGVLPAVPAVEDTESTWLEAEIILLEQRLAKLQPH